jgi:parallel beta-helix repeat protein
MKRPHFVFVWLLVLCLVAVGVPTPELVNAETNTVVVPDDFSTIQEAVDAASEGDTVFVKRGTYNESVCIDQPISLVGEDPATTKIVGEYQLNGTVVLIRHNNVSVTGFTVQPSAYSFSRKGIHLLHVSHCSLVDNVILNNGVGVWLYGSSENNITGNTVDGPVERSYGILAEYSPNNWIFDNIVTENYYGIRLESDGNSVCGNTIVSNSKKGITIRSNNNIVTGNVVTNQESGLVLAGSNNVLRDNKVSDSDLSFDLAWGLQWSVSDFVNDVDPSNTFDGKPVVYWVNQQDKKVTEDAQAIVLVNCTNITVENLVLSNSREGIMLVATTKSTVRNNSVQSMDDAILLFLSSNNTITDNTVYDSSDGVLLCSSVQNMITGNSIADGTTGIKLDSSDENIISGNVISDGNYGGISLEGSNNNKIFGNTVSDCTRRAVWLWNHASQNVFYLNNFFNNTVNVEKYITDIVDCQFPQNVWDNGTTGNYWSDYNGTDTDNNGLGNTPYIIEENNQDNYPLMDPVDISTIPEFPSWTLLTTGIFAVTVSSLIYKRRFRQGAEK